MESATKTTEKINGPRVKQYSVFLPNKVGALSEIVKLLQERNIIVLALDVQDSADCAIVRIVVSDPEQAQELFELHDIPFAASNIVVVELRGGANELPHLLSALLMAEVNIHSCYGLLTRPRGNTAIALHVEDNDCAVAVLSSHSFRVMSQMDISR
ncbi:MAG: acetolactate synthase [Verrucomicrobia bacterium]|nr:acetolactate synthase [Verrucomicrobiota bacterium]